MPVYFSFSCAFFLELIIATIILLEASFDGINYMLFELMFFLVYMPS